jgi:preprotein translocase subunit Sec61beta
MPAASAGLLRFFEEDTPGIKVRPEVVLMLAVALIGISIFAYLTFK